MEQLGDEVRRSLRGAGVPDAGVLAEVTRVWPTAVGPAVAAAAWPARTSRDGTLHVATSSSVWAFELQRMEEQVRERLATALPAVSLPRLRFAVGHIPEPSAPLETVDRPPAPATAAARREAEAVAAPVEDERLRDLVRRAVAASLARESGDRRF